MTKTLVSADSAGCLYVDYTCAFKTADIASKAVTTALINDQAVTAAQIANGTITTTQVSATAGILGSSNFCLYYGFRWLRPSGNDWLYRQSN